LRFGFKAKDVVYSRETVDLAEETEEIIEPVEEVVVAEPDVKRRRSDRVIEKEAASLKNTAESRPKSARTPITQRKITSIYDLERADTRMFRFAQFCFAACKQIIEQLRFVLRVAETNDPELPERARVLCINSSESSHEVCLLDLTWQLKFRIAGIALQHPPVKILEPLKRLIITDEYAPSSTRYVSVDDWTQVLKILDACYLASDDRKLAFIEFMQSKDTVLASISDGTTRRAYVIPATKDKVCVCYSCVDKSYDPTIPFCHLCQV
jgi:hypothetical protein